MGSPPAVREISGSAASMAGAPGLSMVAAAAIIRRDAHRNRAVDPRPPGLRQAAQAGVLSLRASRARRARPVELLSAGIPGRSVVPPIRRDVAAAQLARIGELSRAVH